MQHDRSLLIVAGVCITDDIFLLGSPLANKICGKREMAGYNFSSLWLLSKSLVWKVRKSSILERTKEWFGWGGICHNYRRRFWGRVQLLCRGMQVQANTTDYSGAVPDVHQPMWVHIFTYSLFILAHGKLLFLLFQLSLSNIYDEQLSAPCNWEGVTSHECLCCGKPLPHHVSYVLAL